MMLCLKALSINVIKVKNGSWYFLYFSEQSTDIFIESPNLTFCSSIYLFKISISSSSDADFLS